MEVFFSRLCGVLALGGCCRWGPAGREAVGWRSYAEGACQASREGMQGSSFMAGSKGPS